MVSSAPEGRDAEGLRVAVIGGGHGCYAAAADLAERGHRVRLWRRDQEGLRALRAAGGIGLLDASGERTVALERVSGDLAEIVPGADLVLVPLPATAQESVAEELAPHLEDGQVVFCPPGTLGTYVMARVVARRRPGLDVAWAEAGTLPYLARKRGPALVAITARATRLPTGVFPSRSGDWAFQVLRAVFGAIEPLSDALDAALTNAGPIIHPPLIVLNAAPIENFDTWDIHAEGTQPAARTVQDALDEERIAIREALGYGPPHYPLRDHYSPDGEEWMYGRAAHERLVDGGDWNEPLDLATHRYVREDILLGLGLQASIGERLGLEVPLSAGLVAIVSTIAGAAPGRTMRTLGLADLNVDELRRLFAEGPA